MRNKKRKKNYWITSGYEGVEILIPTNADDDEEEDNSILVKDVDDNLFGQSDEQIVSEINKKGSIK